MDRELRAGPVEDNAVGDKLDNKILKVVAVAGIDLHGLGDDLVADKLNGAPVSKGHAVNIDTGAVGVAQVIHLQLEEDTPVVDDAFGMLHFIKETDGEDRRLVGGHIADFVNVDVDLGVLQT